MRQVFLRWCLNFFFMSKKNNEFHNQILKSSTSILARPLCFTYITKSTMQYSKDMLIEQDVFECLIWNWNLKVALNVKYGQEYCLIVIEGKGITLKVQNI